MTSSEECWAGKAIEIPPSPSGLRAIYTKDEIKDRFGEINRCFCNRCGGAENSELYKRCRSVYFANLSLREFLGDQWPKWVWCGYFEVISSCGNTWAIDDTSSSGNVFRKDAMGWRGYCCHPRVIVCQAQCAQAQAMAIMTDEEGFLFKANGRGRSESCRMEFANRRSTLRERIYW